ncbi:MAG: formate dehydrogenase [Burkholderiales bacterium]
MSAANPNRRKFFAAAAAGSAVAVGAAIVGKPEAPPPAKASKAAGKGYRVTEHIRNYYRTAKV